MSTSFERMNILDEIKVNKTSGETMVKPYTVTYIRSEIVFDPERDSIKPFQKNSVSYKRNRIIILSDREFNKYTTKGLLSKKVKTRLEYNRKNSDDGKKNLTRIRGLFVLSVVPY